jgi:hypothetical protein
MNEGCSACACGIEGACDKLYFPDFAVPGAVVLVVAIVVLVILAKKHVIKMNLGILVSAWVVIALTFACLVWYKTESEGQRTAKGEQLCRESKNPACEY